MPEKILIDTDPGIDDAFAISSAGRGGDQVKRTRPVLRQAG